MIRLQRLVLDNMRNISHGVLDFDDLPAGGSVTGIYGQNGSGKTTVIDAIGILRALLSGNMLPDTAGDAISVSTGLATLTATLLIGGKQKPATLNTRCPCVERTRIRRERASFPSRFASATISHA